MLAPFSISLFLLILQFTVFFLIEIYIVKELQNPWCRWQESGWTYSNTSSFKASQKGIGYYRSSESESKARRFIIPLQVLRQVSSLLSRDKETFSPLNLAIFLNLVPDIFWPTQVLELDKFSQFWPWTCFRKGMMTWPNVIVCPSLGTKLKKAIKFWY